jgi:lysophospholipase L1-like esterase
MRLLRSSLFLAFLLPVTLLLLHPEAVAQQGGFKLKKGQTIVFLGDSITQAGSQPEGYVTLFKLFCGVNGHEVRVINAGISGHKSNDMLARLDKDVLAHHPDWVSISCGVNDVWHGERGVPLPDYKKNMTEMVDRCLGSGAKVLLLTATPIYEDLNSPENQKLRGYNEFLRQLAKEKGVLLGDLFQAFERVYKAKTSDEKVLTTDGVHMNGRGNRLMARQILRALGASSEEMGEAENRWELVNNP